MSSSATSAAESAFYFDTSALVKLVVEEPGSEIAEAIWRRSRRRLCSTLAYPEARAAFAAANRSGRLTSRGLRRAVDLLDGLLASAFRIGARESLLEHAGELAERYELRAYDAVQLASALHGGPGIVLVSWDQELVRASRDAGLRAAPAIE